ncbi:MAG: ADP-ribosylglycohydrolase family protein [Dermabacter sp.]|nr:ADP-ribosylglycohydrolase family protein [Dermabacter sp.]
MGDADMVHGGEPATLEARLPSQLPPLSSAQHARALGSLVGAATGDALGAPYEFEPPIADSDDVAMIGGGELGWGPGEWTDDTAMSIVVLQVASEPRLGGVLTSRASLDAIAALWYRWSRETIDIGTLTATVLGEATMHALSRAHRVPSGDDLRAAAQAVSESRPSTAGNGALMRVYATVLAYVRAPDDELIRAVTTINTLTHVDDDTVDAAVLWALAIRTAILTGHIDVRAGLRHIDPERRERWATLISEAEDAPPWFFRRNGWVIHAFQGAYSAIHHAGDMPSDKFARRDFATRVFEGAVRAGYDTDTVACIAGALAGAALGYQAIKPEWRRELHGWPGYDLTELMALGARVLEQANAC